MHTVMKKNIKTSREKANPPRPETLPLLRGMFICPEPVRRLRDIAGTNILNEIFIREYNQSHEFACD
jgi:hypothetical protein